MKRRKMLLPDQGTERERKRAYKLIERAKARPVEIKRTRLGAVTLRREDERFCIEPKDPSSRYIITGEYDILKVLIEILRK